MRLHMLYPNMSAPSRCEHNQMTTFLRPQTALDRDAESSVSNTIHNNRFKHVSLRQQRELLSIFRFKNAILYNVEKFQTVILIGETGCGKSTQLPLYLHEAGWTSEGFSVVCTQPRRVAVMSVAARVAEEFGCKLGEDVGYAIRFDHKCSARTRIKYCTDGVLLRETMTDPLLSRYSVIVIDEAHQRSLHSDILLGLLKKIQRHRKDDFRLIVMSATLDAQAMKSFFETNLSGDAAEDTASIVSIQGRLHGVDLLYLKTPCRNYVLQCVETVFQIHSDEDPGDVLVFLPGAEEIETAIQLLSERCQSILADEHSHSSRENERNRTRRGHGVADLFFLPLHSALPTHQQMQVFEATPQYKRKVILATNIAEASITIDGVRFVVDCGLVNLNYFDVRSGIDALLTVPISKSAATQRAGRAGRVSSGKCFRLMCEDTFDSLEEHTLSEMQRVDISYAVLQLKALGIHDVLRFDFLSPPSTEAMVYALELLYSLGAIDDQGRATTLGGQMAEMPVEPRIAKCLLASFTHGCTEEMLSIAAMCSVEYPFLNLKYKGSSNAEARAKLEQDMKHFKVIGSDHLTLLSIYRQFQISGFSQSWCDSMSLQFKILSRAKEVRGNLATMLKRWKKSEDAVHASVGDDDKPIRRCLLEGFFAYVARLHNDGQYHTLRGQVRVQPFVHSVLLQVGSERKPVALPEWVLFNEVVHTRDTFMREVTQIDPLWLYDVAPHYYNLKF